MLCFITSSYSYRYNKVTEVGAMKILSPSMISFGDMRVAVKVC